MMPKTMRSVLRASEVQFQGPLRLGLDATSRPEPKAQSATQHAPAQARVRITENHPEFALVELTCSCGKTTYVRCDYADTSPVADERR